MDYIDVIISTKPTWWDISLYYIMSLVVFISFYFIKKIVDKKVIIFCLFLFLF